jgi:hypothetical protein
MDNTNHELIDITSELHTVTGGGKLGTIWKGLKTAYEVGRPILKESAEVAKDVGVIGGVAYGAKKVWDTMTGHGQPAQPAAPQE